MTAYYLGVDGGGTKTEAVILNDEGRVCGVGVAGASNFGNTSIEEARTQINVAVFHAARQGSLEPEHFTSAFLGIAGVVSEDDHAIIREIAEQLHLAPSDMIGVDHDCRIALAGGLAGQPGIVQIIGTGSSCFGMNAEGERWMAGGWGHLIADEGGGYWLGVHAMKAAVAAYDGRGQATLLHDLVLQALEISNISQIMQRLYSAKISIAEIAALSPLVVTAAQQYDGVALQIIEQGMEEVAQCVVAVALHLQLGDAPWLACVGGITQAGNVITEPLAQAVHRRLPACQMIPPQFSASQGAALLARQLHHPTLEPLFLETLRTSLQERR